MLKQKKPLKPDMLKNIDAHWRSANYLSVEHVYFWDNPLPISDGTLKIADEALARI